MTDYFSTLDTEMKDILNYLNNKSEICDISIQEILPAIPSSIHDWETRNLCTIPQDLKNFYLARNGVNIEWKIKLDSDTILPLGKMLINGIHDLTRVGSVLQKDFKEPSIFDLEDLQDCDNTTCIPHFDDRSRNFEIDCCNGYGKVCMVYRNAKTGSVCDSPEFWFLDRSLRWHFLAQSFTNYYRLVMSHLGLPQWQLLFTDDGLPPMLYQWYSMLAPGRVLIHEESWQNLVDAKKSKQSFDPNKVFKEKDVQKKPNQNQAGKTASASNYMQNNTNSLNKRKSIGKN